MRRFGHRFPSVWAATALGVGIPLLSACGGPTETGLPPSVHVVVRGHQEIAAGEPVRAVFLGPTPAVGLCLQAPATMDTSLWEARLTLDGAVLTDQAEGPRATMGPTVCFRAEVPPKVLSAATTSPWDARLGGVLRDRFDGSTFQLPEIPVRFVTDATAYRALQDAAETALAAIGGEEDPWQVVARIDALEEKARQQEAPLLAIRLVLASAFALDRLGSPEALAEVEQRLSRLPTWLEDPAASGWATQAAYAQASLALRNRHLQEAWEHLRRTEELQLRTANFNYLSTVHLKAGIRAQVGTPREAAESLRTALDDCKTWACNEKMLPALRSSLAWLIALDPLARDDDLRAAADTLKADRLGPDGNLSALHQSNTLLNRAALAARLGEDAMPPLQQARELLASLPVSERDLQMEAWADVIEGEWHFSQGRPREALAVCRHAIPRAQGSLGEPEAWAQGCIGRSLRALGNLESAAESLNEALLLHETMAAEPLGQTIPQGPGRRAEDYYAAARVQVELFRPTAAWDLLTLLDHTSSEGSAGGDCQIPPAIADERDTLLEELRVLEGPASGARRQQREPLQRSLRARLQELWRAKRRCSPEPLSDGHTEEHTDALHLRAFALVDEVILLERVAGGAVRTARRTPLDRSQLLLGLERLVELMESSAREVPGAATRAANQASWDDTLGSIGEALLPKDLDSLPPVTTFSLYGPLQGVPLATLPLGVHGAKGERLLNRTIPVVRPAAAVPVASEIQGQPVFVVDPREDLDGQALAGFYRETFPRSKILEGAEATGDALFRSLEQASWLHVDAHGTTDPTFPELSSLLMADRPVTFLELGDLRRPLLLANLSGCKTGRWPVTADSGRYGIGGLLASRSVRWVIASRADLGNAMAQDFNRAFYQSLAQGDPVPAAYGTALRHLETTYPASAWAAFLLLSSERGGQSRDAMTPEYSGARSPSPQPPGLPDRMNTDTGGRP